MLRYQICVHHSNTVVLVEPKNIYKYFKRSTFDFLLANASSIQRTVPYFFSSAGVLFSSHPYIAAAATFNQSLRRNFSHFSPQKAEFPQPDQAMPGRHPFNGFHWNKARENISSELLMHETRLVEKAIPFQNIVDRHSDGQVVGGPHLYLYFICCLLYLNFSE